VALAWLVVSASLLIWCAAAAAAAPPAAPAPDANIGTLQSAKTIPASAANPTLNPLPDPTSEQELSEVVVQAPEPRYAAPTLRDRIGRVWAPVVINGRGPYRLVLDTGATHSAIIAQVASSLGIPLAGATPIRVAGVTGSAIVPAVAVDHMEVGDLSVDSTMLPIVADVFGGAQGVLGTEGLADKRILIDFGRDRVVITRSRGSVEERGLTTLPLRQLRDRLLALDVRVGGIRAKAIIDTGAQVSIGNTALRMALRQRGANEVTKEQVEGVTLDVADGEMMRAPPIEVGSLKFYGVSITYGDMYIFDRWKLMRDPILVLGMDVLGTVDLLVIDYRLRQLQLRLRHS
jgi:predicted aspartyl protease